MLLALLGTSARPDTPQQTQLREEQIALTQAGRFDEVTDAAFPKLVHPRPEHSDEIAAGLPTPPRRVTVPECGHLSSLERPAQVTDALSRWLTDR
jgi:pimeloyl-ACP methyl ester carboxylesterase